jgi:hypothetical protein
MQDATFREGHFLSPHQTRSDGHWKVVSLVLDASIDATLTPPSALRAETAGNCQQVNQLRYAVYVTSGNTLQ